ncbi:MAG: hypothetical protein JXN61_14685 [Sedimentisphaerales bacterium]|nr:hypothetical protein [Sedimentisphaerales bacterium]
MKSYISFFIIAALTAFASLGFAQAGTSGSAPVSTADANAVAAPAFPYVAEIVGDNVYVRSGPGTNYYNSGKVTNGDKVKVVARQFSWSCIVPPPGSFSWIYIPYVSIDPDNPGTGIVTGDNVRVYAGSDLVKPIHSTLQLKLDKGEKVKLLGEQKENYYKIAPPTGAYLWVSTEFANPVVAGTVPPVVETVDANKAADVNDTNDVKPTVNIPTPPKPSVDPKLLAEYKDLQQKLLAERAKSLAEQDYSSIRKGLEAIADNKDAGKVAQYCEYVLKQVDRFELALTVHTQLDLQNKQLKETQDRIEKARTTRLTQMEDVGRFAVVGTLRTSNIFSSEPQLKHYRIENESGKTICYARSASERTGTDYDRLVGKRVGLIGTIAPYPQMGTAIVKFTQIEQR